LPVKPTWTQKMSVLSTFLEFLLIFISYNQQNKICGFGNSQYIKRFTIYIMAMLKTVD